MAEREAILNRARNVSKSLMVLTDFVTYDIPTFERGQLHATGIDFQQPWKSADLIVTQFDGQRQPETGGAEAFEDSFDLADWVEVDVGAMRFFVRGSHRLDHQPGQLLTRVGSSLFMSSPSRRNPEWAHANILTSRGHGLTSGRIDEVREVLTHLRDGATRGIGYAEILERLKVDEESTNILLEITNPTGHEDNDTHT